MNSIKTHSSPERSTGDSPAPADSATDSGELIFKTPPWAHQRVCVGKAKNKRGFLVAHDMGAGKSKTAIDIINNVHADTALIICPKSVVPVWPKQFALHSVENFYVLTPSGSVTQKTAQAKDSLKITGKKALILNYEAAWREPMKSFLLNQKWDVVIADESHRIKSPASKVSWFFKALGSRAKKRLALTGTPMPHSPLDIYAQYRFIEPEMFGKSFHAFKKKYCEMGGYGGYEIKRFVRQDEMVARIYAIAHRVKKEDVLDLPEFMHVERFCEISKEARKIYTDLKRNFLADFEAGRITVSTALVRLLRFQQLTGGYVKTDDGKETQVDTSKQELLQEIIEDLPEKEPLIVFCRFHRDMDAVQNVAEILKRSVSELSGRKNELENWQAGNTDILAVQIQSGGLGIDLTRARYCIYYSLGFSLGEFEQSLARCHRPGQTRSVTYFHLIAQDTIDERVYQSLKEKSDTVKEIIEALRKET